MTQGTKSYLFGCHQFLLHPLFVTIAWKKHHGRFPTWKEAICVLIHDIGIVGRQYIEGNNKDGHWHRGACLAYKLFKMRGYYLVAGHTDEGVCEDSYDGTELHKVMQRSNMFIPDKTSYLYAPLLWLQWCQWLEGFNSLCTARQWRDMVKANMEAGFPKDSHEMYQDLKSQEA